MTRLSMRGALRLAAAHALVAIALATLSQSPASGQEIVSAPAPMTEAQAAVVDQPPVPVTHLRTAAPVRH